MAVHFIDNSVFQDSVSTQRMRDVFDENTMFQRWLDVERAIALASGDLGIIPKDAAKRIAACAQVDKIDIEAVKAHGKVTSHSLMGLLKDFRRVINHDDARYVHWGATTQDIVDTGMMLMIRDAYAIIEEQHLDILRHARPLLETYRDTVMVGRTHGGHALPITFGMKAAIWLDELCRQVERWKAAHERILVVNIIGAVGTFASWGAAGFELQKRAADILGLGTPLSPWATSRDRMAEAATLCALTSGTAAHIAKEIYNLSKTEVRELEEPFTAGKVGSSTMPHKRNPVHTEWSIVLDRLIRANAGVSLEAMGAENERDATHWKAEWIVVPETFSLLSGSLNHLDVTLSGLWVHADRMFQNTGMLKGLLLSERAMFVLAETMPLPEAHELVYQASNRAFDNDTYLIDELMVEKGVAGVCDRSKIEAALDPRSYVGLAGEIADRVGVRIDALLKTP
ncbi:MAG: adenylosuccinate lyase family protein [Rhodospirillaceae bacterium]|nr:adenylosuccinate lyase family protein [Rhodospirillaceae bacterium]